VSVTVVSDEEDEKRKMSLGDIFDLRNVSFVKVALAVDTAAAQWMKQ
jgi:hypothetical protein